MQYERMIMGYDPLHKNPNNVREFQYPLNLLCDVFNLPMHKRNWCDNTFKAIAKHGTVDKLNVIMRLLTDLQRTCISMYYEELLPIEEIAKKLNRDENRIRRCIINAVECLGDRYMYRKRMLLEGEHMITNIKQLNMSDEIKHILFSEGITNPLAFKNLSREDVKKIPGMDDEKISELLGALDILLIFEFCQELVCYVPWGLIYRSLSRVDILYLDLDTEPRRLLRLAGVNSIEDLINHSEAWVRRIPGMGAESVDKIVLQLKNKTDLSFSNIDDDYSNPLEDVAVLGIGTRSRNILIKNNICTIGQLSATGWDNVCDIHGIGYNRSIVIFDKLDEYKLGFKKAN